MKRVFLYEHLTGGADGRSGDAAPELLAAGTAMRDAVAADLQRVPGVQPGIAAGLASLAAVAREAAAHDLAWVIAPETGGVLAQLCAAIGRPRWLGCSAAAIATASSKRATLQALADHGVCTPLAFTTATTATSATNAARWVVKPDDGAGSLATRVHRSHGAALADQAARPGAVLEPWVEGHAMSLSLLCSAAGAELLSVNRQLIGVGAVGQVACLGLQPQVMPVTGERAAPLRAAAQQVHAAIGGLRGFVGIDLVWHAQRGPVVIEVNPRVTSAYAGLSAALGRNLAAEVIAMHLAEHADA